MHRKSTLGITCLALAALFAGSPLVVSAQVELASLGDSLRAEMAVLRNQLDSLRALVAAGEVAPAEEENALDRLRAAARAAAGGDTPNPAQPPTGQQQFVGRARSLQALNPEISVNGDIYGSIQSEDPDSDNFIPREFELSFISALDPYTRAKVFFAAEEEGGNLEVFPAGGTEEEGESRVTVEEGFVEWVGLVEGVGLKVGRFYQQLGQMNRWHSHALPFQSRSLPHLAFIGEEPLAQDGGVSVHWLLPTAGAGAYEATFEVGRSGNEALFGESRGLSYLGHFNSFWQLSSATDLDVGVSALFGNRTQAGAEFGTRLFAVETAFNWIPPERSLYRGVTLRAGAMLSDPSAGLGLPDPEMALGIWSLVEVRLSRQWIAGGRYDWVENPDDPTETAWLTSPSLTYWQSEFVRLRVEYDVLHNPGKTTGQFTFRVTFAMGPHKHENY